jgi:hypothetical protein
MRVVGGFRVLIVQRAKAVRAGSRRVLVTAAGRCGSLATDLLRHSLGHGGGVLTLG